MKRAIVVVKVISGMMYEVAGMAADETRELI